MNKFIVNIILFFIFSTVIYTVSLLIWELSLPPLFKPNISYQQGSYGHLHTRLKEANDYSDIDVLFLGSSHAYRGFDPRIFSKHNFRSFNLGSSAQTPLQTKLLLDRYLDSLNPKLIIYEVYPPIFALDGVEASLDIISNSTNDWASIEMALELNNLKTYNTLLFAFAIDMLGMNSFVEPLRIRNDTYISGGFVEKDIEYFSPKPVRTKTVDFNPEQVEVFSNIVHRIQEEQIDLILVYAPVPTVTYESFSNTAYFKIMMSDYTSFYDFNKILFLNDSLHFYDDDHLNQKGVEIFNERLIEILKQNE